MDQHLTPSTTEETSTSTELQRAEVALAMNAERFEAAMDQLTDKVGVTSAKIQRATDAIDHSKARLRSWKEKAIGVVDQARPYVDEVSLRVDRVRTQVTGNPRPYLLGVAGLVAGAVLVNFFRRRRHEAMLEEDAVLIETF